MLFGRRAVPFLPKTAVLEMTYRCNHACLFCSCPWFDDKGRFERQPELSITEWKRVIRSLIRRGVSNLAFTGGEPLLKVGIEELINFAAKLRVRSFRTKPKRLFASPEHPRLYLLTNGLALDDSILDLCQKHGVHVGISLPGLESFAEHTQAGDPQRVLALFGQLKARGISNHVGVTVTKKNLHELFETLAESLLAGANFVLLNRFMPGGRGLRYADELTLGRADVKHMLETAEEVLQLAGRKGSVGTELPYCVVADCDHRQLNVGSRCSAALEFFVVGPSGYVRVCNHSPVRLASVFEIDRIKDDAYWRRFVARDHLPNACSGCRDSVRCDGGCREAANVCSGTIDALDPLLSENDCAQYRFRSEEMSRDRA